MAMNSDAVIEPMNMSIKRPRRQPLLVGLGLVLLAIVTLLVMPIRPSNAAVANYEQDHATFVWVSISIIVSTLSLFVGAFVVIFKMIPTRWRIGRDILALVLAYTLTGYWYLWCLAISNGANAFIALPEILFRGFPAMLSHAFKWPIGLFSGLG